MLSLTMRVLGFRKPAMRIPIHAPASSVATVALGFLVLLLTGCTIHIPTQYLVMFNGLGHPVEPRGNVGDRHVPYVPFLTYPELDDQEYIHHIDDIMAALQQHKPNANGGRKVLMFVHGGLNTAKHPSNGQKILLR